MARVTVFTLMQNIVAGMDGLNQVAVAVCPPYVYIPMVKTLIANTAIKLGAQDVAEQMQGAFTGEVSAPMLKEFACQYVIVGHSERRALFGEKDADTARNGGSAYTRFDTDFMRG